MVSTAEAATMTVTTSPDEDAAIAVLRDKMNAERPKPLSEQEYQEYMLRQWVDSQVTQGKALMVERYKQAAEQAPVEIQEQVKSLLICGQVVCK